MERKCHDYHYLRPRFEVTQIHYGSILFQVPYSTLHLTLFDWNMHL